MDPKKSIKIDCYLNGKIEHLLWRVGSESFREINKIPENEPWGSPRFDKKDEFCEKFIDKNFNLKFLHSLSFKEFMNANGWGKKTMDKMNLAFEEAGMSKKERKKKSDVYLIPIE